MTQINIANLTPTATGIRDRMGTPIFRFRSPTAMYFAVGREGEWRVQEEERKREQTGFSKFIQQHKL